MTQKKCTTHLETKADRKELDRQFKNEKSNFKIAMVVDMWLTGFDVPFLDTMYIDKPVQQAQSDSDHFKSKPKVC